ncbi:MAG TPA: M48 family metalloprotease [Candidatus Saccharimonadales bacterium]|nr:M48 family metalloprotease [Candidatus Saccharimonadales bacterium]
MKKLIHWQNTLAFGFKETNQDVTLFKFQEISQDLYPKTVAYFDRMRAKYPHALGDISCVIGNVMVPTSSCLVIMFPKVLIDEIEAEIMLDASTEVQNIVEWILLHEAGHIKKEHIVKLVIANTLTNLFIAYTIFKTQYFKNWTTFEKFLSYFLAAHVIILGERFVYSRYIMEPEADDFANELCDNPNAFTHAADWMQRCVIDDILHPTKISRIKKIKQAAGKKFDAIEMSTI